MPASRKSSAAAVSREEVSLLAASFANHKEVEEKWQRGVDQKLNEILETLKPMTAQLQTNTQTLFGPTGNNGLNSDVKDCKRRLDVNDRRWWKLLGAAGSISVMSGAILKWIWPK